MPRSGAHFDGRVGRTVGQSTPWWPQHAAPRDGSPNVLVIVFDDVGFSDLGCYGSEIATPNADRLAAAGLRYNNFHTTAICSSSRACLMTGRNHHAVGMGSVANWDTGFPGYRGHVAKSAGMLSEILQTAGYATFAAGKWHLTPLDETTAAGPYDQWPLARGFDRFHGVFTGGSEWAPEYLIHDNHRVETPREPRYHFSQDIADRMIGFIRDHVSTWPEKPFFSYLCFHACHSPLHAPREYIERYRGRYDKGWDACRAERIERQKALGIVPREAQLAPRNPGVRAWDSLSRDERRLAARLQECFAGMLEHADAQIGRVLDWLEHIGKRDDTLVMLLSDNGGTMDGRDLGSPNWHRHQNRLEDLPLQVALAAIDEIGGPRSYPVYPAGWGQVSNTPLKRYKSQTHGGGVRDPLIVSWPTGIAERGTVRDQFHHLVDVLPTVLEVIGIEPPHDIKGVVQQPIDGVSLRYSFSSAQQPTPSRAQYFEMFGHRGIWKDGWKAVCHHERGTNFDDDRWELYHLDADFSECDDLAEKRPDKLRELVELWWQEAEKYDVLPLDDRTMERYNVPKPRPITSRDRFVYYPGVYLPTEGMPDFRNRSYTISAEVDLPASAEGVLVGVGDATIGFALFVKDGQLVHDYNCAGEHSVLRSSRLLPSGRATLRLAVTHTGNDAARVTLYLGNEEIGAAPIPRVLRASLHSVGLAIGWNAGHAVSDSYSAPFTFTGKIERVVVELGARA
jgi:arylsulfatase A-like enzyme